MSNENRGSQSFSKNCLTSSGVAMCAERLQTEKSFEDMVNVWVEESVERETVIVGESSLSNGKARLPHSVTLQTISIHSLDYSFALPYLSSRNFFSHAS
jgi:hypothetical protein